MGVCVGFGVGKIRSENDLSVHMTHFFDTKRECIYRIYVDVQSARTPYAPRKFAHFVVSGVSALLACDTHPRPLTHITKTAKLGAIV